MVLGTSVEEGAWEGIEVLFNGAIHYRVRWVLLSTASRRAAMSSETGALAPHVIAALDRNISQLSSENEHEQAIACHALAFQHFIPWNCDATGTPPLGKGGRCSHVR